MWCSTVALRRHPSTGASTILALALQPPTDEQPRSRLTLYERRGTDDWEGRTVAADLPIFDADLAFLTDGSARIVASFAGSQEEKTHLAYFEPEGEGWHRSPLNWFPADLPQARDGGAFARITAGPENEVTVAFVTPVVPTGLGAFTPEGLFRWLVAVPTGGGWQAAPLGTGTLRSLTGDLGVTRDEGFGAGFVGQSRRGAVAFAPSLAGHPDGTVSCAFGNGALMLATIDRATLTPTVRPVDVDRQTGFAPSLALTPVGAPTIVYKDDFGPDDRAPAGRDHLHRFSAEVGNAPLHVSVAGFAPYVPLTCRNLQSGSEELLDSVLLHRTLHLESVEGGGQQVVSGDHWAFFHSHRSLNGMIDGLSERPSILEVTIDNLERADEEGIERLHVTFVDPLALVPGDFRSDLDAGTFPEELRRILVDDRRFRMSNVDRLAVERLEADANGSDGRRWRVTDPDPFRERLLVLPDGGTDREPVKVVYELSLRDDDQLEIGIPPLVTVVDTPRFVDPDGNYAPCRTSQLLWDEAAGLLAPVLHAAAPNLAGSVPHARWIRVRDARVTAVGPRPFPGDQQHGVGLTLQVGRFWARGRHPEQFNVDFEGFTTERSEFRLAFAPYIDGRGDLRWWPRTIEAQLGRFEVNIRDWGDLEFLRVLAAFIPFAGGIGIAIANAIIEDIAADRASEQVEGPDLEGWPTSCWSGSRRTCLAACPDGVHSKRCVSTGRR